MNITLFSSQRQDNCDFIIKYFDICPDFTKQILSLKKKWANQDKLMKFSFHLFLEEKYFSVNEIQTTTCKRLASDISSIDKTRAVHAGNVPDCVGVTS